MAATRSEISTWFDRGISEGKSHMVIICDTYDHDDYPEYASSADDAKRIYSDHSNMKRPMEVYKLSDPKDEQMNEHRCVRY